MDEMKKEKEIHDQKVQDVARKLKDVEKKLEEAKSKGLDLSELQKSLNEALKEKSKLEKASEELNSKEKKAPWNVDTISQPGFSKTVFNNPAKRQQDELTEEEREKRMREFTKKYEKEMKNYGMLRKFEDSKLYLQEHTYLVCEDTANYLVIWCINLEMSEKTSLMEHVAHQCICMQYLLEMSKQLDVDPRSCIASFFSRIQIAEEEYKKSFDDELDAFKTRIKKRAAEKIEAAIKEAEEEERLARLGPGGLDPVEVFETLPEVLQKCFESKSITALQDAIAAMPEEEAQYHMKRCVDSGLWVPDANKDKDKTEENEYETIEK